MGGACSNNGWCLGAYDRLGVTFVLDRESGFYMLQIFVPAGELRRHLLTIAFAVDLSTDDEY